MFTAGSDYKLFMKNLNALNANLDEYKDIMDNPKIVTSELIRSNVDSFKKFRKVINNNYSGKGSFNPMFFFRDLLRLFLNNIEKYTRLERIYLVDETISFALIYPTYFISRSRFFSIDWCFGIIFPKMCSVQEVINIIWIQISFLLCF